MMVGARVVFDTSTLIGAMLGPRSVPRQALLTAVERYQICATQATLHELREVLQRPKFDAYLPFAQRLEFLKLVIEYSQIIEVDEHSLQMSKNACRDSKDDPFLALALSCEAIALISSDNDLLSLHPWNNLSIITPAAFVRLHML
jgi:uncharacterized protein